MPGAVRYMRESDFAYAVARIRANELRLLSGQDIEGLLYAGSYEQACARLADKGWGDGENDGIIVGEQKKMWALLEEILPESDIFDSLKITNDYHNLKAALKARLAGGEWQQYSLQPGTIALETIDEAVSQKEFDRLPQDMAAAAQTAYDALMTNGDGQSCETIVDAAALEAAIKTARAAGGIFLELAQHNACRADIRVAVRCARMKKSKGFIRQALARCELVDADALAAAAAEGEEAICEYLSTVDREAADALRSSLAEFERLCDRRLEKRFEYSSYTSLGTEPVAAYIHARQREMRQVRIILAGLRNGVPAESIRELL